MADDRHYTITIYDKTGSNVNPIGRKKSPIAGIAGENGGSKNSKGEDNGAGEAAFDWMVIRKVADYAKRAISYEISTVSLRTGEAERQQRMQLTYDILSRVGSAATTIAMGAKVGGVYGAAAAAAYEVINTSISVGQQVGRFQLQRDLENKSLGLARIRSGDSLAYINGNR